MNESIRLGRIAGITVGVNWSLIAIFVLVTFILAAGRFPAVYPDQPAGAYVAAGLVTAILFFGSVLAHEISHAIVARRNGVEVDGIVLWLLGGVARLRGDADQPGQAFRIAAVGPFVSLVIGVVMLLVAFALDQADAAGLVVESALWLGLINIVLAVFNMFPGAPLDGGRVLRAILWKFSGDKHRAWVQAAKAGQVVGFIIIALGLLQFAAIGVGGLWLMLIGWFLVIAARAERAHAEMQGSLGDTRVADVMTSDPVTAPADISIEELLDDYVFRHRFSTFPVTSDGRTVGLITVNRIKELPAEDRATTRVRDLVTPIDDVPTVAAEQPLMETIEGLDAGPDRCLLVMSGDRVVGIVSPVDVLRTLERQELRRPADVGS